MVDTDIVEARTEMSREFFIFESKCGFWNFVCMFSELFWLVAYSYKICYIPSWCKYLFLNFWLMNSRFEKVCRWYLIYLKQLLNSGRKGNSRWWRRNGSRANHHWCWMMQVPRLTFWTSKVLAAYFLLVLFHVFQFFSYILLPFYSRSCSSRMSSNFLMEENWQWW